jgi:hypothetical protein
MKEDDLISKIQRHPKDVNIVELSVSSMVLWIWWVGRK